MTEPAAQPASPTPSTGEKAQTPPHLKRRRRPDWLARPEIWLILLLLGAVVLAGGGTPVWARAVVMLVVGGWVFLRPPTETPSRQFELALAAFALVALASSFLPAAWLGAAAWRDDLARLGVVLPVTNATSPWLAADACFQFAAGLAWFYVCWNLRLDHDARKLALWGLAILVAALAAGAACGNLLHLKYPLAAETMNFSYFPNRNQSALYYCLGGLIAFGLMVDGLHRRRGRFFVAAALMTVCTLALVMGRSRMALALYVLGMLAIVVARLGRSSGRFLLRVVLPLGLLGLAMLLAFSDHDTLSRIPLLGSERSVPDFRLALWHDTFNLAKAQPAGVGLDQFAQVFPQFRNYSITFQSVRHPDSDWFWLLGETGWTGVVAALAVLGTLVAVFCGKRWMACGPYRHLAAICAGLFLLHSFVDVPGHRWGTWLLEAFLIGVAVPDDESFHPAMTWLPRWFWRGLGIVLLAVGAAWVLASAGGPALNATVAVARADQAASDAVTKKDAATAIAAGTRSAAIEPMQWTPYFQRARTELMLQNNADAALKDFRIARQVEPIWARVPYAEGFLWEPTDHVQAFAAWREALHRADDTPEGMWRDIYEHMKLWPDGEKFGSILSKTQPLFRWEFLTKQVSAQRLPMEMAEELRLDPDLTDYSPMQRVEILKRWADVDGAAAQAYLQSHPKVVTTAWMIEASAFATMGHPEKALELAHQHLPPLPVPEFNYYGAQDLRSLSEEFAAHPDNVKTGSTLARRQMQDKDFAGAAATLRKMADQPNPPLFVFWGLSDALEKSGQLKEAWAALEPCLEQEKTAAGAAK